VQDKKLSNTSFCLAHSSISTFVEQHSSISTVTFAEQSSFNYLDICEDKWPYELNAQINIQSMILPRVK